MAFSPSGDLLASASEDMTVKLWQLTPDPAKPSLVASLRHEDEVASAAFSPDEPVLATGSEGTVHLWNVANPRHPAPLGEPLVAHDWAVVSLAFCSRQGHSCQLVMRVGRFACGSSRTRSIQFPSAHPSKAMTTQSIRSPAVQTGASSRLLAQPW